MKYMTLGPLQPIMSTRVEQEMVFSLVGDLSLFGTDGIWKNDMEGKVYMLESQADCPPFQMKELGFESLGNTLQIRSKSWLSCHCRQDQYVGGSRK